MMESFNQFAESYAGILGLLGFCIGLASAISAVYFYYNPRKSKHRLCYKIYSGGVFVQTMRRIGNIVKDDKNRTYSQHIDVWNAGGEPIAQDVIREPICIALQSAAASRGALITELVVVRETHPGVSNFDAKLENQRGNLTWAHFDPGMGTRLRIETTEPVRTDEIAFFGTGLRLDFRRVRNLSEVGGVPNFFRMTVVLVTPIATAIFLGGPLLSWLSSRNIEGWFTYVSFVAVVLGIVALIVAIVAACTGLHSLTDLLFNTKSPIEKLEGEPARSRFSSDSERVEYLEMRRADAAFRLVHSDTERPPLGAPPAQKR